jgi:wobble nucleotide-excising tRNase
MSEKIELSNDELHRNIEYLEKEIEDIRYKLSGQKYDIEEMQRILRRMGYKDD